MKETPILMCGDMVRATLNDLKTKTRRVITPQPVYFDERGWPLQNKLKIMRAPGGHTVGHHPRMKCPYGEPGDRLWVREAAYIAPPGFFSANDCNLTDNKGEKRLVGWTASMDGDAKRCAADFGVKQTPSIFMPRWASRITLEIVAVRVERVQ